MKKLGFKVLMFFFIVTIVGSWVLIGYTYLQRQNKNSFTEEKKKPEVLSEKDENKDVITESTKEPSEQKVFQYTVADDMPRKIVFPTLSKSGFIQQVGIDKENKIAVPTNIHFAGWYINSVKPGQKGLSILDGHRDGIVSAGLFYNIENLKVGESVMVEYGDGTIQYFSVKKVSVVEEKDADKVMYSKDPDIESQLNLVSCIGKFDEVTREYDKRVIVTTELIEE